MCVLVCLCVCAHACIHTYKLTMIKHVNSMGHTPGAKMHDQHYNISTYHQHDLLYIYIYIMLIHPACHYVSNPVDVNCGNFLSEEICNKMPPLFLISSNG